MKRNLRIALLAVGSLFGLLIVLIAGALVYGQVSFKRTYNDRPVYKIKADTSPQGIARGEYLVQSVMGCADCHAEKSQEDALSGLSYPIQQGPIAGIFSGSNLTPDVETGLGAWTDGEIARAIREGLDRDNTELVIMPSQNYREMSDEDIASVVGYLRSLKPVRNEITPFTMNPPAKTLWAFGLMGPRISQQPIVSSQDGPAAGSREYGAYLVNIGGCRDCHGADLSGGEVPMAPPGSPPGWDITSIGVISEWDKEEFILAMRSGTRPDGSLINPVMPWKVYRGMTEEDLESIYQYLMSIQK
ncbi:MAG: c-type cytochrome [Chloroflexi bacterium]|nr:c-type cytochrome [Chloroflexota bacterium]